MRSLPIVPSGSAATEAGPRWAKLLDQTKCIGCHACTTACKSENDVPVGVSRTYVKSVDVGVFPEARRNFQVTRCNQCVDAPCVTACPTAAMFKRDDGIVDFDKDSCIGCKACIAACPYDAIFINPEDHSAEKCNFCAHRLDMGLEPACVVVCPVEAIIVGDLNDPDSAVAHAVNRDPVSVRRPEKDTKPKVFYKGAHQATLDPLAARRPDGGIFAWAQQRQDAHTIPSGATGPANSSAAALLSYDVGHSIPWDWRVGLYTWTKSLAAGIYLVAAVLMLAGGLDAGGTVWRWAVPVASLGMLGVTGAILIWDLEHPERFYFIFTRPQWRSWLVRGGVAIAAYGAVLGVHFLASLLDLAAVQTGLVVVGLPLSLLAGIYTAYLFAQAKARDLWQNPLLPAHMTVQAVLAGSAGLLLIAAVFESAAVPVLAWVLVAAAVAHLLLVLGEVTLPHVSAHARTATHELVFGHYRAYFWASAVLAAAAAAIAPFVAVLAAPLALAALLGFEHAYVQAGQSVPLA